MSQDESQSPPPRLPGGHLAAGIFLTVGGVSVFSGLLEVLAAQHTGLPVNAIACGVAFAVLFIVAVATGPWATGGAVRGTCGVVAVLFLTACYSFVVDLPGPTSLATDSMRLKLLGAVGVFTVGNLVVGAVVPSSVAGGLAVIGLVGTVLLSVIAAGQTSATVLLVAGLLTALAAMLLALRVPRLRPHPTGLAWMLGVAAVLAAAGATVLAATLSGFAMATAGALILALAALAWRRRSVAAAIVAVPLLSLVDEYVVLRISVGSRVTGQAVALLASGAVLVLLVGVGRWLAGRWAVARSDRGALIEDALLVVTAALALLSLTQPRPAEPPFLRGLLGSTSQTTIVGPSRVAPQPFTPPQPAPPPEGATP